MLVNTFSSSTITLAVQETVQALKATFSESDEEFGDRIAPQDLSGWLARLRMLEGVPFAYLVSDSALLPSESIRFFYLDRSWTDALVQGALSVGTVNSADRAQLEKLYPQLRDELDEEERRVRRPKLDRQAQQGPAGTITGFLLRSRAVSGWPGLHVRAYSKEVGPDDQIQPESHPDRLKALRMERLAPAVLLVLFDGVPAVVHIEEPRQGIQFGVRLKPSGGPNQFQAVVVARDATTSQDAVRPNNTKIEMPVFFRPGAPGVLDLRRTAQAFLAQTETKMNLDGKADGAEFALQMLRFPFRQIFGDPTVSSPAAIADVFRPSVSIATLNARFREVIP